MSTLLDRPAGSASTSGWTALLARELWASVAIAAMWVAVAVTAVWGTDLMAFSSGGSDRASIPSGIVVALFASLGTWAVAKHGFGRTTGEAR